MCRNGAHKILENVRQIIIYQNNFGLDHIGRKSHKFVLFLGVNLAILIPQKCNTKSCSQCSSNVKDVLDIKLR
jgi:hypothetical protein